MANALPKKLDMICIGFGTNKKPFSRLIRWCTQSKWSHVWITYQSKEWGGRWAAHANERGVVKELLSNLERRYTKKTYFICPEEIYEGMRDIAPVVGRANYDFFSAIWNSLLLVFYRTTKWEWLWNIVSRDDSKFFCSEFIGTIIKESGLAKEDFDPGSTHPGKLYQFLKESDDFLEVPGIVE